MVVLLVYGSPMPGSVSLVITPKEKDLGEFSVRRALPNARRRTVGPWIFFDHFGPAEFGPDEGMNVRPHPHIGLATVTYMFEGEIHHRDSLGSDAVIRPGAVNLMVAGRGIVHSERPTDHPEPMRMEGLQLWHALPETEEGREPAFHHYPEADIPEWERPGSNGMVRGRTMMGTAFGVTSPVETFHPTLYFEARMEAGTTLELPDVEELAVYCTSGDLLADGEPCPHQSLAVLDMGRARTLRATTDARFAAVGGAPIGERHISWNFVHSDPAAIDRAKRDWQAGNFPLVPGDSEERIPLPDREAPSGSDGGGTAVHYP